MATKLITTLAFFILSFTCIGQSISSLALDNRQSILNDKAFFNFPTKAANSARATDIMAADPNTNRETRIVMDIDQMRLVFFAQELFVSANNDLLPAIAKEDGTNFKSRLLINKDSMIAVLTKALTFDTTQPAILVNSLMVKTADNSVFRISAYINPPAFGHLKEFQQLSEKVFSSLSKGTRRLNFKARTETFPILDSRKSFSIPLPDGYVVTRDKKYDFEVLIFRKIKDISDTSWSSLTIYTGFHPSFFHSEYGFDAAKATTVKGVFLKTEVEWLFFKDAGKQFYLKEQKIPSGNIQEGLVIHIAMLGSSPAVVDELTALIGKISITEK